MKNKRFWATLPILLSAELFLWIMILFVADDIRGYCYASVAVALLFALSFLRVPSDSNFLVGGLIFTLVADSFLILPRSVSYSQQVAGVCFFSVTQLLYCAYLLFQRQNKTFRILHLSLRFTAWVAVEIAGAWILKENLDFLSVISLFYVTNLALNGIFALLQGKKTAFFAIGLFLFLGCDIFVGLSNAIGIYLPVSEHSWLYKLVYSDFNFIWFFYLPSQTIIAIYTAIRALSKSKNK